MRFITINSGDHSVTVPAVFRGNVIHFFAAMHGGCGAGQTPTTVAPPRGTMSQSCRTAKRLGGRFTGTRMISATCIRSLPAVLITGDGRSRFGDQPGEQTDDSESQQHSGNDMLEHGLLRCEGV